MKRLATLVAAATLVAPAFATDVGVSVSVSQPGVYGRVDIGRFPQPVVINAQPVIITQPHVVVAQPVQPVYLWVPPGHQKKWHKHCYKYNACGMPVHFVREEWYHRHVMAEHRHHRHHDHDDDHHRGRGHGHGKHKHKHDD